MTTGITLTHHYDSSLWLITMTHVAGSVRIRDDHWRPSATEVERTAGSFNAVNSKGVQGELADCKRNRVTALAPIIAASDRAQHTRKQQRQRERRRQGGSKRDAPVGLRREVCKLS